MAETPLPEVPVHNTPVTEVPLPEVPSLDARALRAAAGGELALRFPARWLDEHGVLPVSLTAHGALVAVERAPRTAGATPVTSATDPLEPHTRDVLERRLGGAITLHIVNAGEVRAALLAAPRATTPLYLAGESPDPAAAGESSSYTGDATESLDDLRALAAREPVVQVVNAVLAEAARAGASDVHLESGTDGLRVRMRLDGVLHEAQQLGSEFRAAVISRLKVLAGLDIAERRLPQDGRARVRVDARELDIRVNTLPALHGESVVLRLLDGGSDSAPRTLEGLGFAPHILGPLREVLGRPSGMVLVTGPTGSGKTTTLYAALRERSTPDVKVVTVEDPVEYRLDDIVQLPVNPRAGFGFPEALRAMLRHDPDVILVGEMRDAETAEIAIRAALTGHLVLSTVHTTDAVGAIVRLRDMGVPPYLLTATLQAVLAQRLVRRLCDACAVWTPGTDAECALLHRVERAGDAASAPTQLRRAIGCAACAQTGYRGRVAIAELVVVDDRVRDAMLHQAATGPLRALVRARGVRSVWDDGLRAVREGLTTLAEVSRVVSDEMGDVVGDAVPPA